MNTIALEHSRKLGIAEAYLVQIRIAAEHPFPTADQALLEIAKLAKMALTRTDYSSAGVK